ncbi:signal peptidase I [Virgibacillus siamensis]|uniref:signal peptidase I n=1 Tax=Virgibacillus siamensis TaxID=480071 RepID=UPI0009852324|nr:signal peptidase I [Virgibacillus siamensis]
MAEETAKKKNQWLEWLKAILIAVILAFLLRSFVFATSIVEGESMEPTLEDGETILFNKFVYLTGEPERGDIVIIDRPIKNYVKRIIALPGETIEVKNHVLYIDGKKYEETFISEEARNHTGNFGPYTVPENEYFVMGDNREISMDSRNGLGFIQEDTIIGRSEFIVFPFDEWTSTN